MQDDTHDRDGTWWVGRAALAAAVALAALTVLRWLDAAHTVLAAAQAVRPVVLVPALVVLVVAVLVRHRSAIVVSVLVLTVNLALTVPWLVPGERGEPTGRDLVVVSSNLRFGGADVDALAQQVTELDADVLVIQEATPDAVLRLKETSVGSRLPNRGGRPESGAAGTVVLSRYPVTEISRGRGTFNQPMVSLTTETGEVLVKAVHPVPPTNALGWHAEVSALGRAVHDLVAQDPRPLLVVGDFNATDDHPVFRPLLQDTVDAHRVAGSGWVRTWPRDGAVPAFAHLDHVLVRGLTVVEAGQFDLPGTDHAGVWARLNLP